MHASAHAWAYDTATALTIMATRGSGVSVEAVAPVAEPGPLIAMKLQAVMNRSTGKQGTDLLDIVSLTLDDVAGPVALGQLASVDATVARDIALHVDLWFERKRRHTLQWIRSSGERDISADDLGLVRDLLSSAAGREDTRA